MATFYFNDYIFINGDKSRIVSAIRDKYANSCANKVENIFQPIVETAGRNHEYRIVTFKEQFSSEALLVILIHKHDKVDYMELPNCGDGIHRYYSTNYISDMDDAINWLKSNGYQYHT